MEKIKWKSLSLILSLTQLLPTIQFSPSLASFMLTSIIQKLIVSENFDSDYQPNQHKLKGMGFYTLYSLRIVPTYFSRIRLHRKSSLRH